MGRVRVQTILTEIRQTQSELFQQLCQQVEFNAADPASERSLLAELQCLCCLDADQAEGILPLQSLMNSYDELCCSAPNQLLDPYVYRIVQTAFPNDFRYKS